MKKILLLLFALLLLQIFSKTAYSQSYSYTSPTSMLDIITSVNQKVSELETNQNMEIVNITMDLLVNNGEKTIWRILDPAFKYDALVMGDSRIKKLKIKVYKKSKTANSANTDWDFVDEFSAAKPQLSIEPAEYGQYEFVISADEFKPGDSTGHFGLILYHKNPVEDK